MSCSDLNAVPSKAWSSSSTADLYEKTRPDYNPETVKLLLDKMGAFKQRSSEFIIVELGAGTGKFTRAMRRILEQCSIRNVKIIATEPVVGMYEKFKEMVPGVEILQCPAQNILLPDSSVDAVIAAQCFHWFSNEESVADIYRVLKPQGMLGMIWNISDRSVPWVKNIEEMIDMEFKKVRAAHSAVSDEWLVQVNKHGGFGPLSENDSYKHVIAHSTWDTFIGIYATYSVVAAAESHKKQKMLNMIENTLKELGMNDKGNCKSYFTVQIKWFQKK